MAVTGCIVGLAMAVVSPVFSYGVLDSSDACMSDPGPLGCGSTVFLLAGALPVGGSLLAVLVGIPLTFILRPRPRLRWLAVGLGAQLLGFVSSAVIMQFG